MGKFVKGDVVVIDFPFSDLSGTKLRPALVVTRLSGDDIILCMITTQSKSDGYSISLNKADFDNGGLDHSCYIRPNRLFTADSNKVKKSRGNISSKKLNETIEKVIEIVRS